MQLSLPKSQTGVVLFVECLDNDTPRKVVGEVSKIVRVRRQNERVILQRSHGDVRVNGVERICFAKKSTDFVCLALDEREHFASAKKAVKLRLSPRPTHLSNHWSSRERGQAEFETHAVVCPHVAIVAVRSYQDSGVVDHTHAVLFGFGASSAAIRRRAASNSVSLNAPWIFSHSATAASPSWMRSIRRAAVVIHAEMLMPSSSAAAKTRW
jgi:hypothetical protein